MLSIIIFILLLGAGGALLVCFLRFIVHFYAFNGMSKSRKKKIIKEQTLLKRTLLTYATKSNPTKYYSAVGTWWSLICYYIFCICWITLIITSFVSIFVDMPGVLAEFGRIAFISLGLSIFSVFLIRVKRK